MIDEKSGFPIEIPPILQIGIPIGNINDFSHGILLRPLF
jgi:hypothetical protein